MTITLEMFAYGVGILVILLLLYTFRKQVIDLVKRAILEVEKDFAEKSGKEKLEAALKYVNDALSLLRYLVPNARIIAIIERVIKEYNKFSKAKDKVYNDEKDR